MSGDIADCHNLKGGAVLPHLQRIEARGAATHLAMHSQVPNTENYPATNVSSTEPEERCLTGSV